MKKDILIETLFLKKKDKKHQKKKLGCKFIRINTSNAKIGYDLDYEVDNKQAFINEFKNKKIRKLEKQLIQEKEKEIKVESRKQKVESRKYTVRIKELKDKNKKLKNLTNNY